MSEPSNDALKLKEEGNAFFNSGKLTEALSCYTKAINLVADATNQEKAVLYRNRAAVYLKQNRYENTVNDCTAALDISMSDTKALYRRCLAYESLEKYDEAFKDARNLNHIDRKNKAMEPILRRLGSKIQQLAKEQSSTQNKVKQMFHFLFDISEDVTKEKRQQAASNMIILAREKAGAELICKNHGVKKILNLIKTVKDPNVILACTRIYGELCKDSKERCVHVLNTAGGSTFLQLLNSQSEPQVTSAQYLIQMILNTLVEMDIKKNKGANEQFLKDYEHEIDMIMTAMLHSVSMRTLTAQARDAVLELLMRNVQHDALNWALSAVKGNGIERLMDVASELEDIKYESSMRISANTRTHVAVTLSHIYDNLGADKHRESYKDQVETFIKDKLKGPDIEAKIRVTAAINCLLLGPLDVGNHCLGFPGVVEMMLVMAGSDDFIQQRVAAEAIIAAAAKKDKCTSIISQGIGIMKKLYQSKDDGIRVRALVGLCKLGSFGGHDASLKPFDEDAQYKLAKACRQFLINPTEDKDLRKWAAEGLSYLTLDADIKEEFVEDTVAIKALVELAKTGDSSVVYGVITTLVNLTNSYHQEEVMPELVELAKFAKQHIPEKHPMDEKEYVDNRVKTLCQTGITGGLVALSKTESKNSKELISRVFNAMCEFKELRGIVVQQGGVKSLLELSQDGTKQGKFFASQALARIGITMNPEVAFPGQRSSEAVRPLVALLHAECTGLQNFEALLALTNLAQVGPSIRNRILKEKGFSRIDSCMYEDHVQIKRAATQCMVNMLTCDEVVELFLTKDSDRIKYLTLLCGDEDDETVSAAASALCILTDCQPESTERLFEAKSWQDCLKNAIVHVNTEIQFRGVYLVHNMITSSREVAEKLIETDIMEVLMALTKVERDDGNEKIKKIRDMAEVSLKKAEEWRLIMPNVQPNTEE